MGKHLQGDTAAQMRADREAEEKREVAKKKKFPDLRGAKDGETPDEKDERTFENLQKMMDAGLIQVIKKDQGEGKDDKKPEKEKEKENDKDKDNDKDKEKKDG